MEASSLGLKPSITVELAQTPSRFTSDCYYKVLARARLVVLSGMDASLHSCDLNLRLPKWCLCTFVSVSRILEMSSSEHFVSPFPKSPHIPGASESPRPSNYSTVNSSRHLPPFLLRSRQYLDLTCWQDRLSPSSHSPSDVSYNGPHRGQSQSQVSRSLLKRLICLRPACPVEWLAEVEEILAVSFLIVTEGPSVQIPSNVADE
ncbi:hypothetical protein P4O66_012280 [Electrophorus voltai]|uniref:Uncharacterized protein n=1 Tax=Electrophorus voltai TaxID=2609070 RepID=A0AAD8Z4A6_9TELE|nr:hypothetical protein P4O66_012280 [Electrophorus voltai]